MNENIIRFESYFKNGVLPNNNDYENLILSLDNIVRAIENKEYTDDRLVISDFYNIYDIVKNSSFVLPNKHFSHLVNMFSKISIEMDENGTSIEDQIKNNDFYDFNNRIKEKKDIGKIGSIDQMLMGITESKENDSSFGIKQEGEEFSVSFKNDLLREYINVSDTLSSLIVLKSGYKRLNSLIKVSGGLLRVVYSYYPESKKKGINIYYLRDNGELVNCNDSKTFSILYYNKIDDTSFLRVVSPKKDGVDFINSSLYNLSSSNKIADSFSSVCIIENVIDFFSEPKLKSFDFHLNEKDNDKYLEYKSVLNSERDSFLFSGNKGQMKAGEMTNRSVLKMIPPLFFGLDEFTTLELDRILCNHKTPLYMANTNLLNVEGDIDLDKTLSGYKMPLDATDMLDVFNFNINPFFGEYIKKHQIGFKSCIVGEATEDFDHYKTGTLTESDKALIKKYAKSSFELKNDCEYSLEKLYFSNSKVEYKNELLAKIYIKYKDNIKTPIPLSLLPDCLLDSLSCLKLNNYEMEYFIVDLRKFNIKIVKEILDKNMKKSKNLNKHNSRVEFTKENCDYIIKNVTNDYMEKNGKLLNAIQQKAGTQELSILRVQFKPYIKNKVIPEFHSNKLCEFFSKELEKKKIYLTSMMYDEDKNIVDFVLLNSKVEDFKNKLSKFKKIN